MPNIEERYTEPLYQILEDAERPPMTRVNAFRKLNDIYDYMFKVEEMAKKENKVISNAEIHAELHKIFDKQPDGMASFDSEEKKLLDKLVENPNIKMGWSSVGGKRKRSMKRSIKRSGMKRSMKRSMKRIKRSMKRSIKRSGSRTYSPNGIVSTLTDMLHVVKLHHWRTHDYSVHKATDNLHEALSEQVDSFVEKLLGSKHTRSNLTSLRMRSYNTLPALKRRVEYYKRYLKGMPASLGTDLLNIRDELLGSLNQFSYMLSLH
jgi:hypothetical protein